MPRSSAFACDTSTVIGWPRRIWKAGILFPLSVSSHMLTSCFRYVGGGGKGHLVHGIRCHVPHGCRASFGVCNSTTSESTAPGAGGLAIPPVGSYRVWLPSWTTTHLRSLPRYLTDRAPSSPLPLCALLSQRPALHRESVEGEVDDECRHAEPLSLAPFLAPPARHLRPIRVASATTGTKCSSFVVHVNCCMLGDFLSSFLLVFFLLCVVSFRSQSHGLREDLVKNLRIKTGAVVRCACRLHLRC